MLLYIDPGTGSMFFAALIGIASTIIFLIREISVRIKFLMTGGHVKSEERKHDLVIFSDDKRYWNVFKPICDELERRKFRAEYWTASPDDKAIDEKYEYVNCRFIGKGNKAFAKLNLLNARVCLATTPGLDVYQWKRSKNCNWYVHTFHALSMVVGYRMFGLDFYDAVLLNNDFQEYYIRKLEELRKEPKKELRIVGLPYFDAMKERLDHSSIKKTGDKKTVLMASSWGKSSVLSKYGDRILEILRQTEYNIIIRPHPQSVTSEAKMLSELQSKFPESDHLKWNFDNDNFEVLCSADLMISDFSGVALDFALFFEKPLIYADTSFDPSPYDAAWLEEPPWNLKILPEIGFQLKDSDIDNLDSIIDSLLTDTTYAEKRKHFREKAWMYPGCSAKETVDYLIDKCNSEQISGFLEHRC